MNLAPYLAAGRHVITYGAGLATGVGIMSAGQAVDVTAGFDHLFKGLNEIATGLGILAPIATTAYATLSATLKHQVAAINAASPNDVVQVMKQVGAAALVQAAAETPGVKQITTTAEIAQATPSPKVVTG